tara:strand:- start:1697 stop:2026 length:330 start_codon:yes stop_codon:yes gene_type:complete
MAKTPFKLKGFTGFKSSPLQQDYVKDIFHEKWNPSGTKGFDGGDVKAKTWSKGAKKKIVQKTTKKVATRLALKAVPVVGWASAIYDVGKLGYHSIKEGSLSEGWKKFWE